MPSHFHTAMKNRRSFYAINNISPISDSRIQEIVENAVMHVPSPFNSQSTRIVILLGEHHQALWDIVKNVLKEKISPERFEQTEEKINTSFASGYGTILFFEDQAVVENLKEKFPTYQDKFTEWAEQTSGMHQWAIWTMLEDEGFGVSLQHYNPLIDGEVAKRWNINPKWKLVAQMPFGTPVACPGDKEFMPIRERVFVYK